jgi:hypothetical protein
MSLIQEALKRQQMDQEKAAGAAPPIPPPTVPETRIQSALAQPQPLGTSKQAPESDGEPAGDKKTSKVVLAVLLVLLIIGIAGWLISCGIYTVGKLSRKATNPPPPPVQVVAPTAAPPAVVTNVIVPPPVPVTPPAPPPEATTDTSTATATVAVTVQPPPPVPPPTPPPVPPQVSTTTQANATAPKAVLWPVVGLRGIVGRGRNGSANLTTSTGKAATISVGETIEGIKLADIDRTWIVLQYEGERRTLRVGEKTE